MESAARVEPFELPQALALTHGNDYVRQNAHAVACHVHSNKASADRAEGSGRKTFGCLVVVICISIFKFNNAIRHLHSSLFNKIT